MTRAVAHNTRLVLGGFGDNTIVAIGVQFHIPNPFYTTVQFMLENIVGAVLIFTAVIWIPVSLIVHYVVSILKYEQGTRIIQFRC